MNWSLSNASFARFLPTPMQIWHQHTYKPPQVLQSFLSQTSVMFVDDAPYSAFCLDLNHPSKQCPAILLELSVKPTNTRKTDSL